MVVVFDTTNKLIGCMSGFVVFEILWKYSMIFFNENISMLHKNVTYVGKSDFDASGG